jgi:hypothetical protein
MQKERKKSRPKDASPLLPTHPRLWAWPALRQPLKVNLYGLNANLIICEIDCLNPKLMIIQNEGFLD